MRPSVVSASKSGAVSPMVRLIALLAEGEFRSGIRGYPFARVAAGAATRDEALRGAGPPAPGSAPLGGLGLALRGELLGRLGDALAEGVLRRPEVGAEL